jgi:hypothetical protein
MGSPARGEEDGRGLGPLDEPVEIGDLLPDDPPPARGG